MQSRIAGIPSRLNADPPAPRAKPSLEMSSRFVCQLGQMSKRERIAQDFQPSRIEFNLDPVTPAEPLQVFFGQVGDAATPERRRDDGAAVVDLGDDLLRLLG